VVDDTTHCATWDLLCQLVGSTNFLYVADCKLASEENLRHIARKGRFVTVMPRTHGEDEKFRTRLRKSPQTIRWDPLYDVTDEQGEVTDRLFVCADEWVSSHGYRLLWYRSTRKAEVDQFLVGSGHGRGPFGEVGQVVFAAFPFLQLLFAKGVKRLVTQKHGIVEIGEEGENTVTDNQRQGNASGLVRAACVVLESPVSARRIPRQNARSTDARREL